jgi:hypothetical protein
VTLLLLLRTRVRLHTTGLFQAPHTTGEAIKGGRLVAAVMQRLGFTVTPALAAAGGASSSSSANGSNGSNGSNGNGNGNGTSGHDQQQQQQQQALLYDAALPSPPSMITAVQLGSREAMVAFCKGIQLACPVGSYITPEPGACVAASRAAAAVGG